MDRKLMDFFEYRVIDAIRESKSKKLIYSDNGNVHIVAAKVNGIPLCAVYINMGPFTGGGLSTVLFPSDFEKYLK
jgi:hypothetical protein